MWKNRDEGGIRASNTSPRRVEAVVAGRLAAKKRREGHLVHTADGGIDSERDHRPRPDRPGENGGASDNISSTEVTRDALPFKDPGHAGAVLTLSSRGAPAPALFSRFRSQVDPPQTSAGRKRVHFGSSRRRQPASQMVFT
ncbi:DUF2188 domain-containing protein [Amycolatopsis sp. CA-126428]|uniref:DUF2188 domain-containing protein n=1 Tax=Amycolatopsis sp. CA-126428 TaxID=2073158 RepID=UPI000CD0AF67|nr:DUF2188 domain-containing protein [Amycolatopsis sp. CA-126428]